MLLAQKKLRLCPKIINKTTRLFSGLANLNFKPGYNDHVYLQYLSNSKDNVALLDTYHFEEIFDKYIVQVAGKGFTVVDHPSEVYGLPDAHECIDGNLPLCLVLDIDARQKPDPMNPELPSLDGSKISREDLLSRILIAYTDILYFDLKHFAILYRSNDGISVIYQSPDNHLIIHILYSNISGLVIPIWHRLMEEIVTFKLHISYISVYKYHENIA
ncbi:hypothetical protein RhiirA4_480824 [Rhizophagus irregularis]|uniref:Uncharacterized protein n=1 Tax=Rhizophagus irregularis TaxID=588596 RepID=A0A2I1HIK2_9GLOM|nr:hypothetical protein RhiirA4_480824 [Rhizophagus irregularis]